MSSAKDIDGIYNCVLKMIDVLNHYTVKLIKSVM